MPMNAICRSFPQRILDLLLGEATGGPNRLCTTLFCISSALKKLSQSTLLPDNRCRPSPLEAKFGIVRRSAYPGRKSEEKNEGLQEKNHP